MVAQRGNGFLALALLIIVTIAVFYASDHFASKEVKNKEDLELMKSFREKGKIKLLQTKNCLFLPTSL